MSLQFVIRRRLIGLTNAAFSRTICGFNDSRCQRDFVEICQQSGNFLNSQPNLMIAKRFAKKLTKVQKILNEVEQMQEEDSDDEDNAQEKVEDDSDYKVKQEVYKVNSLRLDTIVKTGASISRSKAEKAFYAGKIYVNGSLATKKSSDVLSNDVIDYIKGPRLENGEIPIRRITLVNWKMINTGFKVTLKKEDITTSDYDINE